MAVVKKFEKISNVIIFSFLSLFFASKLYAILNLSPVYWVDFFTDDAYYYFSITENILKNGFSGVSAPLETNGYQPFLLLLLLFGGAFGLSAPVVSICVQAIFSYLFVYVSSRINQILPALVTLVIFNFSFEGMESILIPFFAILYFRAKNWVGRGIIGVMLFLSRLDTLAVIIAFDLFRNDKSIRGLLHWAIIISVAIFYFLINYYYYGSVVPVSGLVKSIGGNFFQNNFAILQMINAGKYFVIPGVIICMLGRFGFLSLRYEPELKASLISFFIVGFYYWSFSSWPLWPWYFWSVTLTAFFVLAEFWFQFRFKSVEVNNYIKVFSLAFIAIIFVKFFNSLFSMSSVFPGIDFKYKINESFGVENVRLISRLNSIGLNSGTVAMGDRAGSFVFFMPKSLHFFHTEGLTADINYQRALSSGAGRQFFDKMNVNYLVVDREKYIESNETIGVIEPVQIVLPSNKSTYIICFKFNSIVDQVRYSDQKRLVLDVNGRVDCPVEILNKYKNLRSSFNGIRYYSLPSEYKHGLYRAIHSMMD